MVACIGWSLSAQSLSLQHQPAATSAHAARDAMLTWTFGQAEAQGRSDA